MLITCLALLPAGTAEASVVWQDTDDAAFMYTASTEWAGLDIVYSMTWQDTTDAAWQSLTDTRWYAREIPAVGLFNFKYDKTGQLIRMSDDVGGYQVFTIDPAGNITGIEGN